MPLPATLLGDFDGNGAVDGVDFLASQGFGSKTNLAADGNHHGVMDAADYSVWRDDFGATTATQTVTATASESLAPLTASAVLAVESVAPPATANWQSPLSIINKAHKLLCSWRSLRHVGRRQLRHSLDPVVCKLSMPPSPRTISRP